METPSVPFDDPSCRTGRDAVERERTEGGLFAAVYEKLREIAVHQFARERASHTLQATALVHEAWVKLGGRTPRGSPILDRGPFLVAAAEAMRRILIDHARGRTRDGGGGRRVRIPLDPLELASRDDPHDIVALDDAITELARRDERLAEVAKLRIYTGLSAEEVAGVLDVRPREARRDWELARAVLHRALDPDAPDRTGPGRGDPSGSDTGGVL